MSNATSNRLDPRVLAESLERLLERLLDAHRRSLDLTREHQQAVAQADRVRMARCASQQAETSAAIESLNRERGSLLMAFRPGVSLREVLGVLEGAAVSRCEELGRALKDVVIELRREQQRLALASSALSQHVAGLIQQVHRSLSHAGVYSTQGRVEAGATVMSGLDVTS